MPTGYKTALLHCMAGIDSGIATTTAMTDVDIGKMATSGWRVPACIRHFCVKWTCSPVTRRWRAMCALCYERTLSLIAKCAHRSPSPSAHSHPQLLEASDDPMSRPCRGRAVRRECFCFCVRAPCQAESWCGIWVISRSRRRGYR